MPSNTNYLRVEAGGSLGSEMETWAIHQYYSRTSSRIGMVGNGKGWSSKAQVVSIRFVVHLHGCVSMGRGQRLTLVSCSVSSLSDCLRQV